MTRKELLLDATMRVVAEKGLFSFSMKQVTKLVGTSEALIYRHFETKENLLLQCFQSVDRQIAALFMKMEPKKVNSGPELYQYIHDLWMTYFTFLVQNDYRTLFYFEYRDSPYIATVLKHSDAAAQSYFKSFVDIFYSFDSVFHIYEKVNPDYLWTFVLDVTGIFAKRIIRRELPEGEESYENVWRLMYAGMAGLLQSQR